MKRRLQIADFGAEARGKIVHLNYALHGEVNGCQLDDGTFVHLKPEAAKKQHLRVGEQIIATGTRRLGAAGPVLEARSVERSSTSHGAAPRA